MRLSIRGLASPELPLRVLNLLLQHGITPHHVMLDLIDGEYRLSIDAPITPERGELVVAKVRAMVLVLNVTVDAAANPSLIAA